ncbi:MAG: GtrA family protein [Saccharofermentanales bacterium]
MMNVKELFLYETDKTSVQFFRYLFVGGIAFAADFGTLAFLVEVSGFRDMELQAAAIAFIIGLTVNYLISKYWIFKNHRITNKVIEFAIFALIGLVGLGINELIILFFQKVLSEYLVFGNLISAKQYYLIGKVFSTVIVFVWNFAARKIILFRVK